MKNVILRPEHFNVQWIINMKLSQCKTSNNTSLRATLVLFDVTADDDGEGNGIPASAAALDGMKCKYQHYSILRVLKKHVRTFKRPAGSGKAASRAAMLQWL